MSKRITVLLLLLGLLSCQKSGNSSEGRQALSESKVRSAEPAKPAESEKPNSVSVIDTIDRDILATLVGRYKTKSEEIHTDALEQKDYYEVSIQSSGEYLKKHYNYTSAPRLKMESTDNIKGHVWVSKDSLILIPSRTRKYPSRMFSPDIDNRGWIDDSEKEWSECSESGSNWCEVERYSIKEFLSEYRRLK